MRRLHRLAVDDGGAGGRLATEAGAHLLTQPRLDGFKRALAAPEPKIVIHRLPRRQIMREQPPAPAATDHIVDAVEDLPPVPTARASSRLGGWNKRFDDRPLAVR